MALGLIWVAMRHLGLDRPILTSRGALFALEERYGRRKANNLFGVLLRERALGGWDRLGVSRMSVNRYRRDLLAAGVGGLSDQELPALPMPTTAHPHWSLAA